MDAEAPPTEDNGMAFHWKLTTAILIGAIHGTILALNDATRRALDLP